MEEGKCSYRGISCQPRVGYGKKSAEAIVVTGNEPQIETVEVSQGSEGLNVRLS